MHLSYHSPQPPCHDGSNGSRWYSYYSLTAEVAKHAEDKKSFTAEDAKGAKEKKSFTAGEAKDAEGEKSITAEHAKDAKDYIYISNAKDKTVT